MSAARGAKSVGPVGRVVAGNVRALRKARGMTMEQLVAAARNLDRPWHTSTITRIEGCQRHLDADDLALLATALDVPLPRLFEEQPPCEACHGAPPTGFACLSCGAEGAR